MHHVYILNMYLYRKVMNIKLVMKLAAGHSVSNMFSGYIPPLFSYGSFFTCGQGNDGDSASLWTQLSWCI